MVTNRKEHTRKSPAEQGPEAAIPKPMKIGASTPYDFQGSNLTAYGGLLPVVTMLEKLQFRELIEQHVGIKRLTTSMPGYRFLLAMMLALYVGFSRLNHLQFLEREPMLTGILEVKELPVQSTFWRFLVAAPDGSEPTVGGGAANAAASLASRARRIAGSHARHRHDRANCVRPPNGSAQGIQP